MTLKIEVSLITLLYTSSSSLNLNLKSSLSDKASELICELIGEDLCA